MTPLYVVSQVFEHGFGFGDSNKPSFADMQKNIREDLLIAVNNLLRTGHVLTYVDRLDNGQLVADDGCGDGRAAVKVYVGNEERHRSLNRAKVFGGGVTMTLAMQIGAGRAQGKTLTEAFHETIELLESRGIEFGAHTDNHSHDGKSGCGAIDNAPVVLANVAKYHDEIIQTILALDLGFSEEQITNVVTAFEEYQAGLQEPNYSGAVVVSEIQQHGKVIKELDGEHKELFVLLNMVEGMTADQALVRDITEGQVQLFDVDVWRLQQLASAYGTDDALISELVYTLGVAATLTHGDLPVYAAVPARAASTVAA